MAPQWALAAPGDATLFAQSMYGLDDDSSDGSNEYVESAAVMNDLVYLLLGMGELRAYDPSTGETTTLLPPDDNYGYYYQGMHYEDAPEGEELTRLEKSIHVLIPGDDALYGLNSFNNKLAKWDGEAFQFLNAALDVPETTQNSDEYYYTENRARFVYEGAYYELVSDTESGNYNAYVLRSYDLESGAMRAFDVSDVRAATTYQPGKLLLAIGVEPDNSGGSYIPGACDLVVFDISTGKTERTVAKAVNNSYYSLGGLSYDAQSDMAYFVLSSQVQQVDSTGAVQGISFLPITYVQGDAACGVVDSMYYVVRSYEGLYIRNISPEYHIDRALRIAGAWDDELYQRFIREHPEVPVLLMDDWYSGSESIADAIKSGDKSIDIFVVSATGGSLQALMEKGYTMDLSSNEKLVADVSEMYEAVQEVLRDSQGRLMAFPQYFYMSPWFVNLTLFEEYFPGEELPETLEQWLDLYIDYMDRYDDDHDVAFTNYYYGTRESLTSMVLTQYIRQQENPDEPVSFQDPQLRAVLEKIESMELNNSTDWENMSQEEIDRVNELYNRETIFTPYSDMFMDDAQVESMSSYNNVRINSSGGMVVYSGSATMEEETEQDQPKTKWKVMPPPVFAKGDESSIEADLQVYIVNPVSDNQDLAMQYLEYAGDYMDARTRVAINPNNNEPVRYAYYESNRKSQLEYIDSLEKALEESDDENRQSIEDALAEAQRWYEESEANDWQVSAQAIETFRSIASYMSFATNPVLLNWDSESGSQQIYSILERYIQGQLTLDAMLKELDGKARMIFLEGR